jgi:hypothetical protein
VHGKGHNGNPKSCTPIVMHTLMMMMMMLMASLVCLPSTDVDGRQASEAIITSLTAKGGSLWEQKMRD